MRILPDALQDIGLAFSIVGLFEFHSSFLSTRQMAFRRGVDVWRGKMIRPPGRYSVNGFRLYQGPTFCLCALLVLLSKFKLCRTVLGSLGRLLHRFNPFFMDLKGTGRWGATCTRHVWRVPPIPSTFCFWTWFATIEHIEGPLHSLGRASMAGLGEQKKQVQRGCYSAAAVESDARA